jgi:threonine/homoserine/homoserine lactone efflux protein
LFLKISCSNHLALTDFLLLVFVAWRRSSRGPISTTIVSQAPHAGWLAGRWWHSGHALLELVMVLLITVGLEAMLLALACRRQHRR